MDPQANYVELVRTFLSFNKPISAIIGMWREAFMELSGGETKRYLGHLLQFLTHVQLTISKMESKDSLSVTFQPELKDLYRIEFFGIAKLLIQEHGFASGFIPGENDEDSLFIIYRVGPVYTVCDGCRVLGKHEHSCHGNNAKVQDEYTNKHCECQDCLELKTFMLLGVTSKEGCIDMDNYLRKIAAFYVEPVGLQPMYFSYLTAPYRGFFL